MSRRVVLDTHVVLDWLWFQNEEIRWIGDGVASRAFVPLVHVATLDELRRVLDYPALRIDKNRQSELLTRYETAAVTPPLPTGFSREQLMLPETMRRCRDSDDDIFLAIAYHGKADALITKDKALLKLRKNAARHGVRIFNPIEWSREV